MTDLLGSIDDTIGNAARDQASRDAAAVSNGTMAPEDAISSRLGGKPSDSSAPGDTGRDTGLQPGAPEGPRGAGTVSQQPGTDVSGAKARPGDAGGGGPAPAAPTAPTRAERQTLVGYL